MNLLDSNREREDEVYFAAAGIADPKERASYLDEACAGSPALRQVVEEMLASQEEAEELITRAAAGLAGAMVEIKASLPADGASKCDLDEVVGTRIDRYKVLQRLGDGGCGAVYMAEQELPVRRRVALKVIKLGMDTESVIARFETERQMLAMMDHPNIAHVLDAGATDDGRPYFVMELVSGTKITDYCDQNRVPVKERLNLFIQVCQAVQHAHQKGIIHRDLKPSNILVALQDGKPVPKVIDFGVAKAIQTNLIAHNVSDGYRAVDRYAGLYESGTGCVARSGRGHPQRYLQPGRFALRAAKRSNPFRRQAIAACRPGPNAPDIEGNGTKNDLRPSYSRWIPPPCKELPPAGAPPPPA